MTEHKSDSWAEIETVYAGETPDVVFFQVTNMGQEQLEHYAEHARHVFGEEVKLVFLDVDAMEAAGVMQNGRWPRDGEFTKYDRDPDALAWARSHVQGFVDKMRRFEKQAMERGDAQLESQWRKIANSVSMTFIGGNGCVIGAFDQRLPQFVDLFEKSEG